MSKQIPNLLKYLQTPQVMLLLLGFSFALFATGFAGPVEVRKGKAVEYVNDFNILKRTSSSC